MTAAASGDSRSAVAPAERVRALEGELALVRADLAAAIRWQAALREERDELAARVRAAEDEIGRLTALAERRAAVLREVLRSAAGAQRG